MFAGFGQPVQGSAAKQARIHDRVIYPVYQHADMHGDKAHVMGKGHPAQAVILRGDFSAFLDAAYVGQYVVMSQQHAFGRTGRSGRKLYKGQIVCAAVVYCAGLRNIRNCFNANGMFAQRCVLGFQTLFFAEILESAQLRDLGINVRVFKLAEYSQ